MIPMRLRYIILLTIIRLVITTSLFSQIVTDTTTGSRASAVKVFIDCNYCDNDYIKSEIVFVNYVRDYTEAEVHVLVTTQRAGSGGTEYTLTFIGKKQFTGVNDTLTYNTKKADSQDMTRAGLVRVMKLGLIRYVSKSPTADGITISSVSSAKSPEAKDQWDFWVFSVNANTYFNGEQASKSSSVYASLSANRVTNELKVNISGGFSYNQNSYDYLGYSYESFSRGKNFNALAVASISDHWSAGGSVSMFTSTYENIAFSFSAAPAIEYDLFPYSESTRRQLRFLYRIDYTNAHYVDTTIYDKMQEQLMSENLSISLDVKEMWGSAGVSLEGSHYFHDFSLYNIGIFGSLSLRLIEGLSLNLFGNYARIHDQLSLPKEGATEEEVLLRRRVLETQYRYFASVGISYTFGSIFNNIVNPRFGSRGGGSSFFFSN